MSWQAYVDSSLVGTHKIDKAAITSRAGDSTWASSTGFTLSPTEMKALAAGFDNADGIQGNGVHVHGVKYLTLRADDRSIYAKQGKEGIVCVRTKQAILLGHYDENTQPGEATKVVEALADYLLGVGF